MLQQAINLQPWCRSLILCECVHVCSMTAVHAAQVQQEVREAAQLRKANEASMQRALGPQPALPVRSSKPLTEPAPLALATSSRGCSKHCHDAAEPMVSSSFCARRPQGKGMPACAH